MIGAGKFYFFNYFLRVVGNFDGLNLFFTRLLCLVIVRGGQKSIFVIEG